MITAAIAGLAACVVLSSCASGDDSLPRAGRRIEVLSTAFQDGERIPAEHSCDGADRPVPLSWDTVRGADEYVVTMTDPDAPGGRFVHWIVFGIQPQVTELQGRLPEGARQGLNGFGDVAYGGPCPPRDDAPHRYEFVVYAVKGARTGDLSSAPTLDDVIAEIRCCITASGRVRGIYAR